MRGVGERKYFSECMSFQGDGITLFECAVSQVLLAMIVAAI